MNKADFAMMILSCDRNIELIPMFLRNLSKYWPQYSKEIYINTESKKVSSDRYSLIFPSYVSDSNTPWAERLYRFLDEYPYEYVLFVLDDFILGDYVDEEEIKRIHEIMQKNKKIACFNFMETYRDALDSTGVGYERYYLKRKDAEFRINLQAAIWRKDFLMRFIRKHENPWQFETWGSIRSRRFDDEIYHIKKDEKRVFTYLEGGVFADNRWRGDESVEFMKKEGFDIDFSIRGIYHDGDQRKTEIKERTFLRKVWEVIRSLI